MKKFRLGALALTAMMALALSSCGSDDVPEVEKPVKITYGTPEFSIVSTTSPSYKDGKLKAPIMGEESQFVIIAKKAIYRNGVLSDQVKQGKVSDIKVELAADWATVEKTAANDTTMQVKLTIKENEDDKERATDLAITFEDQKFKINLTQDKAVIEYGPPMFQNDCEGDELLFSRSGDTVRKLRFRVISLKTVNGKESEEYSTYDAAGWTWEIDRTDIFYITNIGDEAPGIKVLTLKAQKNDSEQSIDGKLTLKYSLNGISGTIPIPMNSYKGFIIDVEDGRVPEFH